MNWIHFSKKFQQKVEKAGIDPATSRMRIGRSTIWATPPVSLLQFSALYTSTMSHLAWWECVSYCEPVPMYIKVGREVGVNKE